VGEEAYQLLRAPRRRTALLMKLSLYADGCWREVLALSQTDPRREASCVREERCDIVGVES
jgi:hypothetical protein